MSNATSGVVQFHENGNRVSSVVDFYFEDLPEEPFNVSTVQVASD